MGAKRNYDAIVALSMMIDADPAQISKDALKLKQQVENRIGNIELQTDTGEIKKAFENLARYSKKFKKSGLNLTQVYDGIFDSFSDPNKSIYEILENLNSVESKLKHLASLKGYQLDMMAGFEPKQLDAVIDRHEDVINALKKQNDLTKQQKNESDRLLDTLKEIDKYETRDYSKSSTFTGNNRYKNALADNTVKSLGKNIGVDTSNKSIYKDVQEYSKLLHILTVLNEEKNEYSKEYKSSNKKDHIKVLLEEYKIYLEIEKVRKRLSSYDGFDGSKLSSTLPKGYVTPNINSVLQGLNKYHDLAIDNEKEIVNKCQAILDGYIEDAYNSRIAAMQKTQARIQEEFDRRKVTIKTDVVGDKGTLTTYGQIQEIGEQANKTTGEVTELDSTLDKLGADNSGLDLWQKSAENLKEEFGDLVKYAVSAEDALKKFNKLGIGIEAGKFTQGSQEWKDFMGYGQRILSLDNDYFDNNENKYSDFFYLNETKYDKQSNSIDKMTQKQLQEIEKLKVAHVELGQESEKAEGKLKAAANLSTEELKELTDTVKQLVPLFTSLGTENLFKGINTDELRSAFELISKNFGDDLNNTILDFKQELEKTGKADYSAFFDSIRETLLEIVKQFQISLQNVKFTGVQTNEIYRLLDQWTEASKMLVRSGNLDFERAALINTKTGQVSNSYLSGKEGSIGNEIFQELNKMSSGISGEINELYNTWVHSHPFRDTNGKLKAIGSDIGFSRGDLAYHNQNYQPLGITNMMVTSNGKYASIDWSGIEKSIIDKVIDLYSKNSIFNKDGFIAKLATENGLYNYDKKSQLINNALIDAMTASGISDAKSRVKMGNISELNADLSKMQMEEAEAIQKSEDLLSVLKSISDVLDTFNNSSFKIAGIDLLISSLGEVKELLSFINSSLKNGISVNAVKTTLPSANNPDLKSAEKLATQSKEAISNINKMKDSVGENAVSEKHELDKLSDSLIDVIEAIDAKTQAFKDEETVVTSVVSSEIASLERLKNALAEVTEQARKKNDEFKETVVNSGQDVTGTSSIDGKQGSGYQPDKKTDPASTKHNRELISSYKDLIRRSEEYFELRERASSSINGLTSIEKDQLKELELAWSKATEKIEEYAVKSNGSFGSVSEAKKIQGKFISSQEEMYDKYQKGYISDIEDKVKTLSVGNFTDEYKEELSKIDNLINELKTKKLNLIDDSDAIEAQKIKDTINSIINASNSNTNILAGSEDAYRLQGDIYEHLQRNSGMLPHLKTQFKALGDELASYKGKIPKDKLEEFRIEFQRLRAEMEASGKVGTSFFDKVKNKIVYGWAQIAARYLSFYDFIRYARKIFENVKKYDTALTEMRKVSDETVRSLKNFQKESYATAEVVGTTAEQLQKSTADWMRLGEVLEEAKESAEVSNILLNVSEFENIDAATESLVAMSAAYKDLDKIDIVDKLNEVGNNYAISTDGLAIALQNSASALVTAGNDIDEAIALTTAGNAVTQDPNKVGTGLRTISLRITGTEAAKEELEELGEDTSDFIVRTSAKSQQAIKDFTKVASNGYQGFDILDDNGNFKSTYEIMLGISEIYQEILETDKKMGTNMANGLLETLAGKNRSNIAASILQNPQVLKDAYESSQGAAGSAQEELEKYLESLDGHISKFKNASDQLINDLVSSDLLKWIIDFATNVVKATDAIVKFATPLGTLLGAGAGILGAKGLGFNSIFNAIGQKNKIKEAFNVISTIPADATVNWNEWTDALGCTDKTLISFLNKTKGTERTFENYQKYVAKAGNTTSVFASRLKMAATNIGVMLLVSAGIKIVTAAWDKFNTTVGEAKEDLEETQNTIKSLKEQIKELEKLDANSLTQGQKDKLENLKEQLKVQEQLEAIEKRRLARETIGKGNFADYFDKDSYKNAKIKINDGLESSKYNLNSISGTYLSRQAHIKSLSDQLNNTEGLSDKEIENLKNDLINANKHQNTSIETILGIQDNLISTKADIQSWITTIQGYIDDGSLVGSDYTTAQNRLLTLKSDLANVNAEIERTNNLLYGGDDSWENVLAEKTKYSVQNLLDYGFTEDELEVLSTLTFDKNATLEELKKVLEEAQKESSNSPVEVPLKFSEQMTSVHGLSSGLDQLDSIMADVIDGETFDYSSILNNDDFYNTFGKYKEEYENFIKTITESPDNISKCQQAFNDLATAFINNSDALNDLTEETREAAILELGQMGIKNAEEVVDSYLKIDRAKKEIENSGYDLANISYEEAYAFMKLSESSETAKNYLFAYYAQKLLINNNGINTVQDCIQLKNLASAAGYTGSALLYLAKIQALLNKIDNENLVEGTLGYTSAYSKLKEYNNGLQTLLASEMKVSNVKIDFGNGAKSMAAAQKDASDATDKLTEALEKEKSALEKTREKMETLHDAIIWFYDEQIEKIDDKIDKINEENEELEKQRENMDKVLAAIESNYDAEIKLIQDKIDALQDENDEEERALALEEAKRKLQEAKSRKTLQVYEKGKGFVYTVDSKAIKEAEEELEELQENEVIAELEKQIEKLEEAKEKWSEIPEAYEKAMQEIAASKYFGSDWKNLTLFPSDELLNSFQGNYTGIQGNIESNENEIDSLEKEKEKIDELKKLWEDAKNAYQYSQYESKLSAYFGSDYEYQLLSNSSSWRKQYANEYSDVCSKIEELEIRIAELSDETSNKIVSDSISSQEALSNTVSKLSDTGKQISDCEKKAHSFDSAVQGIKDKTVTVTIKEVYESKSSGWYTGGWSSAVGGRAKGGIISKDDKGDLDFVAKEIGEDHMVALTEGEAVIPKSVVDANPGLVSRLINSNGKELDLSDNVSMQQRKMDYILNGLPLNFNTTYTKPSFLKNIKDIPIQDNSKSIELKIGDIHLHGVQDVDGFARALKQKLPMVMQRELGR